MLEEFFEDGAGMFDAVIFAHDFGWFIVNDSDPYEGFFFVVAVNQNFDGDIVAITKAKSTASATVRALISSEGLVFFIV